MSSIKEKHYRRKVKDPAAPKKPLPAYILFNMKERANVQKEFLNTNLPPNCNITLSAKVNKEVARRWANLDSEVKKIYEEASLKDRKRYEKEMKIYKPSKGFLKKKAIFEGEAKSLYKKMQTTHRVKDHFEDYFNYLHINWKLVLRLWQAQGHGKDESKTKVSKTDKSKKKGESKAVRIRNPLVPKRPLPALFLYAKDKRAEVLETSPNLSSKGVVMELGQVWSDLGEDERAPYIKEASKQWKEFKEDMKSHFKAKKQDAVVVEMNESANIQSFQATALEMDMDETEVKVEFDEDSS